MSIIGWLGAFFLAICSFPEVFDTIRKGHNSSSFLFLLFWILGEIFLFIYVLPKRDYPLLANYVLNIILISILLFYNI